MDGTSTHPRHRPRLEGIPPYEPPEILTPVATSVWPWERFEKEVGSRLPPEERHDPANVELPPHHPDIPSVLRTLARYYDCIAVMDRQAGEILREGTAYG